jgi:hypothetical protein
MIAGRLYLRQELELLKKLSNGKEKVLPFASIFSLLKVRKSSTFKRDQTGPLSKETMQLAT